MNILYNTFHKKKKSYCNKGWCRDESLRVEFANVVVYRNNVMKQRNNKIIVFFLRVFSGKIVYSDVYFCCKILLR